MTSLESGISFYLPLYCNEIPLNTNLTAIPSSQASYRGVLLAARTLFTFNYVCFKINNVNFRLGQDTLLGPRDLCGLK